MRSNPWFNRERLNFFRKEANLHIYKTVKDKLKNEDLNGIVITYAIENYSTDKTRCMLEQ